jgi:hypothetical protein
LELYLKRKMVHKSRKHKQYKRLWYRRLDTHKVISVIILVIVSTILFTNKYITFLNLFNISVKPYQSLIIVFLSMSLSMFYTIWSFLGDR